MPMNHRIRQTIAGLVGTVSGALIALGLLAAAVAVPAGTAQAGRVIIGEFQNCQAVAVCRNASFPPSRLDVLMWEGNLGGENYWVRCLDDGGTIRFEYWPQHDRTGDGWAPVCVDVDT